MRKLLTVGHSYVVSLNRRLAHEMAVAGRGKWEVTCVAPNYFHGANDLGPVTLERTPQDAYFFEGVPAALFPHEEGPTLGLRMREEPGIDETVVEDDVGAADPPPTAHGDEIRPAGAGTVLCGGSSYFRC